jgi:hypothetical protein
MNQQLAPHCIYTMRSSTDLDACFRGGGAGSFTENKKWTTGSKLFGAGLAAGEHMPILFAAAERDSGLIYWAVLSDVVVDDGDPGQGIGPSTTYSLAQLAPITPSKRLSDLRLLSSGKPLSDSFIRPYAICHTPSFVA